MSLLLFIIIEVEYTGSCKEVRAEVDAAVELKSAVMAFMEEVVTLPVSVEVEVDANEVIIVGTKEIEVEAVALLTVEVHVVKVGKICDDDVEVDVASGVKGVS